ncbi:uncharacterized protein BX664DRAFT_268143 [Halteromyces radiatus]|uniref:uncharacterized protein n=1 Tax=Halteromyces radiatus TaxID=101107 RepID=UPI00222081BB|nr:uncharacterized protein BX664DRAFT_268143 [Halteromyces radiatus]KAI8083078.1 hypothetical protein BX664DRAFT_268143 [Halteromyces radiatus]
MVQAKTSPDPSPTSSSSSRTRPISVPLSSPPLAPEELEDNSFYIYLRSHFNTIFTRSIVVCIPHSRSLEGLVLTKDFIETHCYNSSPYYRGQYQAANGKVISIEQPLISSVSGFKEQRTVHIMSEEWVYIGNKKIRVYMIQRPLEGEASQLQKSRNTINIPICRNSKSDFDFLNMFAENVEPLLELQSAVQEFVDTYVYIRGFNNYTVEKIQHIYTKAYKTILQRNKLLRDACRIQAEHDHFLELVENVIMGFLHEKIWIQSLRSVLQSQDAYLYSICECYSKDNITLQRYTVSYPISEMPLSCFDQAIACLRQTDADNDVSLSSNCNVDNNTIVTTSLAFTPLEKIVCVKSTLDLITKAVDDYANELKNGSSNSGNNLNNVIVIHHIDFFFYLLESSVTTDEMIPLLAYVITHARISRIASLAFYMEHFRLSHMERSEHG